jgi:tetratricopeptide (TPR) repeat protein
MRLPFPLITLSLFIAVSASVAVAQPKKAKVETEADAEAAQQRTIAISLVSTLADEARSFKDQTRRARVQARAADVLWDSDPERARELFRRAWEAAEIVDADAAKKRAEEMRRLENEGGPVVVRGGPDLRSEVLRLVAKRDRKLGEEFLKALDEAAEKARSETATDQRLNNSGTRVGASQRLQLARRLAEDGEVQRALEFAAPALDSVNPDSIFFLSTLREKNAQLADSAFATLLARVVRDPNSDANTVSGLSSYLFTPFLYVTFDRDGGSNQSRSRGPTPAPADIDANLRNSFFKVAYQILMQPLPAPDQDHSTSGQSGKYLIIKRLLPLFEQYSADLAPGLRTQMTALASYVPPGLQQGENRAVNTGIMPESSDGDPYQRMQERLDHAGKAEERDAIYADYAVAVTESGDPRAKDLVDKIENAELRKSVKAYTDFQLVQVAIRNKDATEVAKLVKTGELTSVQKVWALTNAAKFVVAAERSRATDMLEEALTESRRISGGDPDRARALTAVAAGFSEIDRVRAWEILGEVVKAANGAEDYTGEDSRISSRLQTKFMVVMNSGNAEDFDLIAVFRHLARADLLRAVQLAKTFTGEAPRAVATLAIARAVLEKRQNLTATN